MEALTVAEEINENKEPKDLVDKVLQLLKDVKGATTYHTFASRIFFSGKGVLDYINDELRETEQLYALSDSSSLPMDIRELLIQLKDKHGYERRDFIRYIMRRIESNPNAMIIPQSQLIRRIALIWDTLENQVDVYPEIKHVRVRVPATILPPKFKEIIELYAQYGYGISGYASGASQF